MGWIQSWNIRNHVKTGRVEKYLGWETFKVVGFIHSFWHWVQEVRDDGILIKYTDEEIAHGMKCELKAIKALFDAGWIDPDRKVHKWFDINEKYLYAKLHTSNMKRFNEIKMIYRGKITIPKEKPDYLDAVREIIEYLNKVTKKKPGKGFKIDAPPTIKIIRSRLNEKYTVEDCKLVIDFRQETWGKDNKMKEYIRPSTLFRPSHFSEYVVEAQNYFGKGKNTEDNLKSIEEKFK